MDERLQIALHGNYEITANVIKCEMEERRIVTLGWRRSHKPVLYNILHDISS